MSNKREFRCIHCGQYFTLSDEEEELLEEGYLNYEPNECDDCLSQNIATPSKDDDRSETNMGL